MKAFYFPSSFREIQFGWDFEKLHAGHSVQAPLFMIYLYHIKSNLGTGNILEGRRKKIKREGKKEGREIKKQEMEEERKKKRGRERKREW